MTALDIDRLIDEVLALGDTPPVDWKPIPNMPARARLSQRRRHHRVRRGRWGGKSEVILGKAFTQFYRARIYRRRYSDLIDFIERGDAILNGMASFVFGDKRAWYLRDRTIRVGAVDNVKDLKKFQGRAMDFLASTRLPNGQRQIFVT